MDVIGLLLSNVAVLAGIILLVLGLWTYFHQRDRSVYQTLSAMLISCALWLFSVVLWHGAADPLQQSFWIKILFFAGSFMPTFFLLFTLALIGRYPRPLLQTLFFLPSALLYAVAFSGPLLVRLDAFNSGYSIGPAGKAVFATHFALAIAAALGAILLEIRRDPAFDKWKIAPLLVGAGTSFMTVFVMLFSSSIGVGASHRGPEALAVSAIVIGMFAMTWMTDTKRIFADLRPVGGDIFVLVAILLISMDVAVARSQVELGIRIIILVLLVIYGTMTMRTAARELRRLHEIDSLHEEIVRLNGRLIAAGGVDWVELYRSQTDMHALLVRVVAAAAPEAEKKGVEVSVSAPVGLPKTYCDAGKLHHAVFNLIKSAIGGMEEGGVSVSAAAEGDSLVIKVADSGAGLDHAELERLRAGFGATGKANLNPPMLAAKLIIEAHGGRMFVESPGKGHGSTVGFRIPLA